MRRLLNTTTIAILALASPIAALANLTGTQTLPIGTSLSLDTGTTGSAGSGDILFNGTILPQGSASVLNLGSGGASTFNVLSQSTLSSLPGYSTSAIPATTLVVNDVFAVKTNGHNYAAVLVTAVNPTAITLQFITFGVSSGPTGPTISQVLNNYSLIPAGFSNSGIAQGALFIIKGSGLATPSAQAVLQSSASGLPNTLNGASVSVTVSGTTVTPVFYYAIATQLALVLPSNTPVGNGTITASYNNQASAAFPIQVVSNAMGLLAYYGTGSGLGLAVNTATGTLYGYGNSIPPGTTILLYGSGLGADPARDTTYVGAAFSIPALAHIYVGGVDSSIFYQGASGFPGLNQVNVTIPANAPLGCNVPVVGVNAAGVPTNIITLPINPGGGPCTDAAFGFGGSALQTLSTQSTVKTGIVALAQSSDTINGTTTVSDSAFGDFQEYTNSSYGAAGGGLSLNGCSVTQGLSTSGTTTSTTGLDAGTVTVAGETGSAVTLNESSTGSYSVTSAPLPPNVSLSTLPSNFVTAGGQYTFHGSGGTNAPTVGNFSANVVFSNPLFTWTNQSAASGTITRSAGLPVSWSGGAGQSFVVISGSSSATVAGQSIFASFTCFAPQSLGSFTVPGYILEALPAGTGNVGVSDESNFQTFTASGLDIGYAFGEVSFSTSTTFN